MNDKDVLTSITCSVCHRIAIIESIEDDLTVWFWLPEDWSFNDTNKEFFCPSHKEVVLQENAAGPFGDDHKD